MTKRKTAIPQKRCLLILTMDSSSMTEDALSRKIIIDKQTYTEQWRKTENNDKTE